MNKDAIISLLLKLDNQVGISGYEGEVGKMISQELSDYCDEFILDNLGNHIFIKKARRQKSLKVMLCSHMDELGFIVKYIEEDGKIRFSPIGFHDERILFSQDVYIHSEDSLIDGVINAKPLHLSSESERDKKIEIKDLFIDIGTNSKQETLELNVRIGDLISFNRRGRILNNTNIYSGKSVDNRSGCAVMVQVMKEISSLDLDLNVYGVGSVMEEIGMRGAKTAATRINPDIAIVLDVTPSNGIPDVHERDVSISIGKGPAIKYFEWDPQNAMAGTAVPKMITDQLVKIAENNKIPYQREVLSNAATDGWSIAMCNEGIMTGVISLPSRYIHTTSETVSIEDIIQTIQLLTLYLKELGRYKG